ncbi:P-II family nitrogen regulator [Fimbriimonas ginsengisoli]|uniref:Nitrogen regulatory protein P-II n=1 Tax=Fimbriimonas ginsengisoli Gsoil 348 TaxID=661478 RepID=A0A068NKP5_FIMGI|nr:P-II family nitrogen regulator [Fimbriimonas ginsengisoli]AIE84143.1 Nitrogen regulatory protein P-II [Fimbriimonas ginsengisoli Gsoil 348]
MIRVVCFIRPHRLEPVKSAISALGISGLSVSDVRGTGNSPERADFFGGDEGVVALPIRARLEVVVPDDMVDTVTDAIVETAQTGEPGDGKIFLERVIDAVRIRTEERGEEAV